MRKLIICLVGMFCWSGCGGSEPQEQHGTVGVYYSALAVPQPRIEETVEFVSSMIKTVNGSKADDIMDFSIVVLSGHELHRDVPEVDGRVIYVTQRLCPEGTVFPLWRTDFFHRFAEHHVPWIAENVDNIQHAAKWRQLSDHMAHTAQVQLRSPGEPEYID